MTESDNPKRPEFLDLSYDMFLSSIEGEEPEAIRFNRWIEDVEKEGLFAFESIRMQAQYPEVNVQRTDGSPFTLLNFSAYNYLGYSYHPEVINAAKSALGQYGLGACGSPIQAGTLQVHKILEAKILDFIGVKNLGVSLFSSGYGVNIGSLTALMKKRHHIVIDESAHMSLVEGAQLAQSKLHYFRHNDAEHLKEILAEIGTKSSRTLVCTEGIFSADGDFGDLKNIVPIVKQFNAEILVDEAHSFLVAGPSGKGTAEMHGVLESIDYLVITFSKALGAVGGAVITQKEKARYIDWYARCRMFSCAIDPAASAGVTQALTLAASRDGAERRKRLIRNSARLRSLLQDKVNIGNSDSWVVPVIYGSESNTIMLSDFLQRNGLEGSIMEFPAVPMDEARIRLFVSSEHTEDQISRCAEVVTLAAKKFGFHKSQDENCD